LGITFGAAATVLGLASRANAEATAVTPTVAAYEGLDADPNNIAMDTAPITGRTDLVANGVWHMHGAAPTPDGLRLTPLDLEIEVREDDTYGQYSFVNLFGTHVEMGGTGNFTFETTIKRDNPDASCVFELDGQPPIMYDDGQWVRQRVKFRAVGDQLQIGLWDGSSQTPSYSNTVTAPSSLDGKTIQVQRNGDTITVLSDGTELVSFAESGVFSSGQIWTGFAAESRSQATATAFITPGEGCDMTSVDTYSMRPKAINPNGLQQWANKLANPIKMGAAISTELAYDKGAASLLLSGNYSETTLQQHTKLGFIFDGERWSWEETDAMIDILQRNGVDVHGHVPIYSHALPKKIREMPTETSEDKAAGRALLHAVVDAYIRHLSAKGIKSCDVANEFMNDPGNNDSQLRESIWYKFFDDPDAGFKGEDYIIETLRTAHAADPEMEICLNENGLESLLLPRVDATANYVGEWLKQPGVPEIKFGFQSHIYQLPRDAEVPTIFAANIAKFRAKGVKKFRISEMDVTEQLGVGAQALQYAANLGLAIQEGMNFMTWGSTDRYGSTTNRDNGKTLQYGNALPWDVNEKAKPAVLAMILTLGGASLAQTRAKLAAMGVEVPENPLLTDNTKRITLKAIVRQLRRVKQTIFK
jgi:GH35 family endo-1,4-beta-xylanase